MPYQFRVILPILFLAALAVLPGYDARASGGGPRNLPPYEYVQDGDFVRSCRLLLEKIEPKSEWNFCRHYLQGFMDAKLVDGSAEKYCIPDTFTIDSAIKEYIDKTAMLRTVSLYYRDAPANRLLNIWFDEHYACKPSTKYFKHE